MSAKIITCFNQKGGCGKTMVSMQLAGAIGLRGFKTLVVDMDQQGSALIWASKAPKERPFPATVTSMAALHENMIEVVQKESDNYDVIIIDCPPAIESRIPWVSMSIADITLITIIPAMDNHWAARPAKEMALRAKEHNPEMQLYYVLSNVRRGAVASAVIKLLEEEKDSIKVLGKGLSQRNDFSDCQLYGASVHALNKTSKAVAEIESLTDAVLNKLQIHKVRA